VKRYTKDVQDARGIPIQIRVGLNAGEVVVRSIGNDLHMDYTAVGQTTHLASRMEQMAAPGSILMTGDVLPLVEGYVEVRSLGPVNVKGLKEPIAVYELIQVGQARTRLQAAAARGLTRFVGREAEIETLSQAQERARAGHGQLVALVGEPGVGKSRLFWEFIHSDRTKKWLLLESGSVSYGKATAYLPVIHLLKVYFQIEDRDDLRKVREKVVGKIIALGEALKSNLSAFLALLDVPTEDDAWEVLDPPQRRQRTLEAIKRLLLTESQRQPLLLVFEDLHWLDSETETFIDNLIERLPTARILLLVNYRPQYHHHWGAKTYYTQLRIDPLAPENAEQLLVELLGKDPDLQTLQSILVERTDGNPFFLEEAIRTLVETKMLIGERGAYRLARTLEDIRVPATVQAVLAARIDRLPPDEKGLLQSAAVIGKDVPFGLLRVIAELGEPELRRGLKHLQGAEFLYEACEFPELEYNFKHALTHEVAYESLLHKRRHDLHARITEAIEHLYRDRLAEQTERLAHHAVRGEVWGKAVIYLRQAGRKATARSSHREAAAYFEQALVALEHLPLGRHRSEEAIDVRFDLRNSLHLLGEYARILDDLREAQSVAEAIDERQRLGWICSYMTQYLRLIGDPDGAMESGQRALAIAESLGDSALEVATNTHLGPAYGARGDYRRAIEILGKIADTLVGDLVHERFRLAGFPSVISRINLAWCLAELGDFTEGITHGEEGMRIAEEVDDPHGLINACFGLGTLFLLKGEWGRAILVLERGLGLCRALNLPFMFPHLASSLGSAYALSRRLAEAIPLLEQAVQQAGSMTLMSRHSIFLVRLGEAYLLAGRTDDAIQVAERALQLANTQRERGHEAYTLRLLAETACQGNPSDSEKAEQYYRQALALAGELGMRPLLAHCNLGLAKLYRRRGERASADEHLAAATELFRAMDMGFWLQLSGWP